MKPIRLSLLAGAMTVLAACSSTTTSNPAADPSTADVTVTSTDMVFDTETITVAAGEFSPSRW